MATAKLVRNGSQLYGAAVLALALPTGWAMVRFLSSALSDDVPSAFHGVRLGMTASDVRSRFDAAGQFDARPEGPTGWTLVFRPRATGGDVREASFEMHEGVLVAVRARTTRTGLAGAALGLTSTEGTVRRVTARNDGLFDVVVIARSCPAHAAEVRRLLADS